MVENKTGCSFKESCFCFNPKLCFEGNIESKECGGPTIRGLKIVMVANISSGGHKIAIISQCPKCKLILGVVTGDKEPIPYRADSVTLSEEAKKRIPKVTCKKCYEPAADKIQPAPVLRAQATA